MERNPNDNIGGTNADAGSTGGAGAGGAYGSTGAGYGATGAYGSTGATGGTGTNMGGSSFTDREQQLGDQAQGMADKAKDAMDTAKDKVQSGASAVADKASNLKSSLADALESGAEKLRQRGASGAIAGATGDGSVGVSNAQVNRLAGGMQATADWVRNANMDDMQAAIERQVREHPGRSLLVAVGLGYLLGKAIRR